MKKGSKRQLSVRVPEDVFTHIVTIETNSNVKRTQVIVDLLRKGIKNNGIETFSSSDEMSTTRLIAEEQLQYKKQAADYKRRYEDIRNSMRILKHPLLDEIQNEGIKMNGNVFKSINELFDYLNTNLK